MTTAHRKTTSTIEVTSSLVQQKKFNKITFLSPDYEVCSHELYGSHLLYEGGYNNTRELGKMQGVASSAL